MAASLPRIGISAIGIHEPSWVLHNDWFHGILPTKFVQHTGIESRRVSWDDEVTMAVRAVEDLCRQSGCRLHDCAGLVFTASSLMPASVGRKYLGEEHARRAGLGHAAGQFRKRLGLPAVPVVAINWGCSGYPKALATVRRRLLKAVPLRRSQFLLAVTVNRTSKILDYACRQTAGLFGDFAQATLLARCDSRRYPVHFELLLAAAETCPAEGVFFDYHPRENVLVPTIEGGRRAAPQRLVFSLNGMGIGDAAPRAMAAVAEKALRAARIDPKRIRFVIPHQAGAGIVRLAAMRLAELGIRGEVINGLTRDVANISSSSVPYAIKREWDRLRGIILCPTAGVGNPGDRSVTQGCLILKTTRAHRLAVARRAALRRAS
ncbi:MAG: hypothetical protein ABSF26_28565 [Thermoguttaceae bacterium]